MVTEAPKGDGTVKLRDRDQYSSNPELRRRYWLGTAANRVSQAGEDIAGRVDTVQKEVQGIVQNGSTYARDAVMVERAILTPYQDQAAPLLSELGDFTEEKGFRWISGLSTPREHREIGSTNWIGYFEADPDVPVPLIHDRLLAAGDERLKGQKSFGYTVEELDRARRLIGQTALDLETGRLTDEIDEEAASDPYHFLSPERKAEVVAREQIILNRLHALAMAGVRDFEPAWGMVPLLSNYMDGKLTSPQMREAYERIVTSKGFDLNLSEAIKEAKQIAFGSGNWDRILTPQEILLRFKAKVDKRYKSRPYTPLAIQDGEPIEEIEKLRQGEGSMVVTSGILPYAMPFGFRIEVLDDQGSTVKSPTFLDRHELEPAEDDRFKEHFASTISVPFARQDDWYYRQPVAKN